MRALSKVEENRLKILTKNSVSVALIEPTETGLKKSIMDATHSVRTYFKKYSFHDFELQPQGEQNKIVNDCKFYQNYKIYNTKVSLYRPITKSGDSRIWVYKLNHFCNPNDLIALILFNNSLHVFNLTQLDIESLLTSEIINPFQELINEINTKKNEIASELLIKLKVIAGQGFIKSDVNSDTGIGRTLESILGLRMNSSKTPDYKGIELKSYRDSRYSRKGLFGKIPNWELSKFKSRVEILDNFGYMKNGVFRLYNTIRATGRNRQGLILRVEGEKDWLLENSDRNEIGDFLVWELETLRKALLTKHKETFWVSAESMFIDSNEYFLFKEAEHTKNPMVDKFEMLIETGAITVDYSLKRMPNGVVTDKGCNFKLKSNCLDLLFPPSEHYKLLEN